MKSAAASSSTGEEKLCFYNGANCESFPLFASCRGRHPWPLFRRQVACKLLSDSRPSPKLWRTQGEHHPPADVLDSATDMFWDGCLRKCGSEAPC